MARIVKVGTPGVGKPYEVRWSWYDADGTRRFKSARFRTETEAKAKRRAVEDAVASANMPNENGGKQALDVYAQMWLDAKRPMSKPSTFRSYKAIYNASVKPTFGNRRINAIAPADVRTWVHTLLARKLAPPTIKHHVWVLRQIFGMAAEDRAITYNPALGFKLPTDKAVGRLKPEPRFLSPEEVEAVAAKLDTTHPYGLLVRFTAWTGLRAGEVAGLNVADVDLMRKTVLVRRTRERIGGVWIEHTPKSGKPRNVPLVPWLVDDLRAYLAQHPRATEPNAPLWPGGRSGGYTYGKRAEGSPQNGSIDYSEPWERGTFYRSRFVPACIAAGVASTGKGNGVRFHDLRHSYASICASRGVSSPQVAQWMGHASDVITRQIYTHLFETDTAAAAQAMAVGGRPTTTPPAKTATVTPIDRPGRTAAV